MLDQLRQIAIFAKTVDHGSFRSAARALELSPSVVSHHVARLEEQLGTPLLYRTTRKLSITADGKRLLVAARSMIEAAEAGLQAVSNQAGQPSGELFVTAPAVLSRSKLVDKLAAFTIAHPKVRLRLDFTDSRRDVIGEGIDVAIRMGNLRDSGLVARKIYDVERRVVAARSYFRTRPVPKSPQDLADWDWLELIPAQLKPAFRKPGNRVVRLTPRSQVKTNDAHALHRLALAGAGVAILPDILTESDIASGAIQHVLPDWAVASIPVYAVRPPNASKEGLSGKFVAFLLDRTNPVAPSA